MMTWMMLKTTLLFPLRADFAYAETRLDPSLQTLLHGLQFFRHCYLPEKKLNFKFNRHIIEKLQSLQLFGKHWDSVISTIRVS